MAKKSVKEEADKENKSLKNEDVEQSNENQENIDVEVVENTEEEKPESETNEQTVDFELKFNELNDKYLRLSAEYDNFRKRSLKEKMELIKTAGEDILLNILPVMDNFERALRSINATRFR
jgi:molecular chaperone GrpE